jgi:hypothetical protein
MAARTCGSCQNEVPCLSRLGGMSRQTRHQEREISFAKGLFGTRMALSCGRQGREGISKPQRPSRVAHRTRHPTSLKVCCHQSHEEFLDDKVIHGMNPLISRPRPEPCLHLPGLTLPTKRIGRLSRKLLHCSRQVRRAHLGGRLYQWATAEATRLMSQDRCLKAQILLSQPFSI